MPVGKFWSKGRISSCWSQAQYVEMRWTLKFALVGLVPVAPIAWMAAPYVPQWISAIPGFGPGDDPAIIACEARIEARLLAPGTYKRISDVLIGTTVAVVYDAENVYGTPIRSDSLCHFELRSDGNYWFVTDKGDDYGANCLKRSDNEARQMGLGTEASETYRNYCRQYIPGGIVLRAAVVDAGGLYPIPPSKTKLEIALSP